MRVSRMNNQLQLVYSAVMPGTGTGMLLWFAYYLKIKNNALNQILFHFSTSNFKFTFSLFSTILFGKNVPLLSR
jgi:hypothetical protein